MTHGFRERILEGETSEYLWYGRILTLPFSRMLTFLGSYPDIGVIALRIALCAIFLAHGPKKLNGSMGTFMLAIGVIETAGAAAVLMGIVTRWAAVALGIVMIGAIYKKVVEWHVPFAAMDKNGWEFDLMILAGCIALAVFGAGTFSLDAVWFA